MNIRPTTYALIVSLTMLGCTEPSTDDSQPTASIVRDSEPDVLAVSDDDPGMNAASAKARATVDEFVAVLKKPRFPGTYASIKARFTDKGETEHMWLVRVLWDGKAFRAILANEPAKVKNVAFKDELEIPLERLTDWMLVENGKLIGGYTIRHMRDRMPEGERAAYDAQLDYTID